MVRVVIITHIFIILTLEMRHRLLFCLNCFEERRELLLEMGTLRNIRQLNRRYVRTIMGVTIVMISILLNLIQFDCVRH